METKTAAELVALVVREIPEHPEYDHIAGVSVMPRIPQGIQNRGTIASPIQSRLVE
jgi:hypothetical protein